MKSFFLNLIFIISAIFLVNCDNNDDASTTNDCSDSICTTVFAFVSVTVVNENSEPVVLDDYKVIDINTDEDITPLYESEEQDTYILATDNTNIGANETREIQFIGYIDSVEIINSNYSIEADCCHVSLRSGDLDLIISD